jgi:hypothetical protein
MREKERERERKEELLRPFVLTAPFFSRLKRKIA